MQSFLLEATLAASETLNTISAVRTNILFENIKLNSFSFSALRRETEGVSAHAGVSVKQVREGVKNLRFFRRSVPAHI